MGQILRYGFLFDDVIRGRRHPISSLDDHIVSAADWLLYAQQQGNDGGVPHSFDVRIGRWHPSYPETTGYIIPTLYDVAAEYGRDDYRDAADRMARWETSEQFESGGVRAGHMGAEIVVPTIFNTGQVLFGWARHYLETSDTDSWEALRKAADWLCDAMDDDGAWRRYASPFAPGKIKPYNVRCAFGLIRAYEVIGNERYRECAHRNAHWVVSQGQANSWLPGNCLTNHPEALTHTIAYAMRGILEVGHACSDTDLVNFASDMARHLLPLQRADGAFPGRVNEAWQSKHRWTCITGNSQLALNFFRLREVSGSDEFVSAAQRANRFNMSMQNRSTKNSAVRGAMKGSHPIQEEYMTWRFPNWAAKFFIDALLQEKGYSACKGKDHDGNE